MKKTTEAKKPSKNQNNEIVTNVLEAPDNKKVVSVMEALNKAKEEQRIF